MMRIGGQYDAAGIIAPSPDADRAVRYLAKYLTKAIADPLGDRDSHPAREAHIDRLHAKLRWLPCSPRCANWLRYGNPTRPTRTRPRRWPLCQQRRIIGNTSAAAAAASWSPATGPARPSPGTKPTEPPSSVKR